MFQIELIHCCRQETFVISGEGEGFNNKTFLRDKSASFTPNSVFLSSHHDDLGSKCAYTCHLSNKTTRKYVLLSTPQIWLKKVSKKQA